MFQLKRLFYGGLAWAFGLVTLGLGIWALSTVAGQVNTWLKTAYWPPYTVLDAIRELERPIPHSQWLGVQRMISAVLDWSGVVVILGVAFVFFVVTTWAMASYGHESANSSQSERGESQQQAA